MNRSWKDIRSKLTKCSERDLIGLVQDLYKLDKRNKTFLHARFTYDERILDQYISIIRKSFVPRQGAEPWDNKINLQAARKAINDYKKAIGDELGIFELMVVYAECGVNFIIDYNSDNSTYYTSIQKMMANVQIRLNENETLNKKYFTRVKGFLLKAKDYWGYKILLHKST